MKQMMTFKRISLALTACAIHVAGCNDPRTVLELADSDVADVVDSDVGASDVMPAPGDTIVVDADRDALSEPDTFEDATTPPPDVQLDTEAPVPFDCSMVSIVCLTAAGAPLGDGDSVGTAMIEMTPRCELAIPGGTLLPENIVWSSSISGLTIGSLTLDTQSEYEAPTLVPGELVIRAVGAFGELSCEPELRLNVVPPNGFFAVLTWDDGFPPDTSALSDTDIDTHLVRGPSCFENPQNDLYFVTDNEGLDWGVPNQRSDDPRLTYDSRTSPGFEASWIEVPDPSETVFLGVHGFGIRALVGDSPVNVDYSVYIGGMLVAEGVVPITKGEYAAVGALRAGEWLPATVETRPDGQVCPVLSTPAP